MKKGIVLCSLIMALQGCGAEDLVQDVIDAIDDAVYTLDQNSAEYQNIINNLLVQLENIDSDLSVIIRSDIQNLLERTPAVIGQEFRCNVDFIVDRLQQSLQCSKRSFMLSNLYSGTTPIPDCQQSKPAVCSVVPSSIQQELNPAVIDIYGYDFDIGITSNLTGNEGDSVEVTNYLSMPTHYHMTLNLGDNGVPNIYKYDELEFLYLDNIISTVSIIQGKVCRTVNPGSRTIILNEIDNCPIKSVLFPAGISIYASTLISTDQSSLDIGVEIVDLDYVFKRYRDTVDQFSAFKAPVDSFISVDTAQYEDSMIFYDDDDRINYIERGNSGLVNQYEVKAGMVDCNSDNGYVKVTFNPIEICTSSR